nr:hypothetical protein StreXyl84_74040 [Streptomyces sp. Xyl84]
MSEPAAGQAASAHTEKSLARGGPGQETGDDRLSPPQDAPGRAGPGRGRRGRTGTRTGPASTRERRSRPLATPPCGLQAAAGVLFLRARYAAALILLPQDSMPHHWRRMPRERSM